MRKRADVLNKIYCSRIKQIEYEGLKMIRYYINMTELDFLRFVCETSACLHSF
jgi:hypothetical protein